MKLWIAILPIACISGFTSRYPFPTAVRRQIASLNVAIDPTLITTKEFQDISGDYGKVEDLDKILRKNVYTYPKHVEVIKDFENVVDEMVNDVVSINTSKS